MPVPFARDWRVWPAATSQAWAGLHRGHACVHPCVVPPPPPPKKKDGLVVAFISNCGARNNRGEVLEKLIKVGGF